MRLTQTTNSRLSKATSLDASHISRLRRGERNLVREADYLRSMAVYFAKLCDQTALRKALAEVLGTKPETLDDLTTRTERIYDWLLLNHSGETASIDNFLAHISNIPKEPPQLQPQPETPVPAVLTGTSLHYGIEGKKNAVLGFLSIILESGRTGTLLLYSDEPTEWMSEDPVFLAKWSKLLKQVLQRGNRIKIIHTINRNLDELLGALAKWMPIYMTGAVEPYYYPKVRDGVFKRTLFIFPEAAALTSTSIDGMANKAVNILLQDEKAIHALSEEFHAYFQLCRPLMRIFTARDEALFLKDLEAFDREKADAITEAAYLSLGTIPPSAAESILARMSGAHRENCREHYLRRSRQFLDNLTDNRYYEVIQPAEIEEIQNGKVKLGFSGILHFEGMNVIANLD